MEAASNSDCSSSDEWADLTKSDYAKVIFSQLSWNRESGTLECSFSLTESVTKNSSDYIGLFKVGFENVSQCLISKTLDKMESENTKLINCCFKSEELPELNGFYQFCYITHDQEVCGASTPIEVKHGIDEICSSNEDVFTEGVEGDFLMVRSGLEKKNLELLAAVERYRDDKLVLMIQITELLNEKGNNAKEVFALQQKISEYLLVEEKNAAMKAELDICRRDHINVSAELLQLEEQLKALHLQLKTALDEKSKLLSKAMATEMERDSFESKLKRGVQDKRDFEEKLGVITKERDHLSTSLDHAIKENKKLTTKLESVTKDKENAISQLKMLTIEMEDLNKEKDNFLAGVASVIDNSNPTSINRAANYGEEELEKIKLENRRLNNECDAYNIKLTSAEEKLRKAIKEKEIYSKELQTLSVFLPESAKLKAKEEELNDAKLMIKALEDSKLLVMDEMRDLMQKLNKAKDELSHTKCENIVLKVQTYEKTKSSACILDTVILPFGKNKKSEDIEELKMVAKRWEKKYETESAKLLTMNAWIEECEHRCAEATSEMNAFKEKLEKCKEENIESKEEIKVLNQMVAALKEQLNEEAASKKNAVLELKKYISNLDENDFNKSWKQILAEMQKYSLEKDSKMMTMENDLKLLQHAHSVAVEDLKDKTARLLNACEVYRNLYIEKSVLAKKLKKVMKSKSLITKSDVSAKKTTSQSSSLAVSREESISNNSDSDTGERVRSPTTVPNQVSKLEMNKPSDVIQVDLDDKNWLSKLNSVYQSSNDLATETAGDAVDEKLCVQDEIPLNIKKSESKVLKGKDGFVRCQMCRMCFTDSPLSNTPMLKHYETEHNMDMCPLCGVLFDRNLPRQYLQFHVDNHFLTN